MPVAARCGARTSSIQNSGRHSRCHVLSTRLKPEQELRRQQRDVVAQSTCTRSPSPEILDPRGVERGSTPRPPSWIVPGKCQGGVASMAIASRGAAGPGGGPRSANQVGTGCAIERTGPQGVSRYPRSPRQGNAPGRRALLFRHPGLVQTSEISGFEQGADLRHPPRTRNHKSDRQEQDRCLRPFRVERICEEKMFLCEVAHTYPPTEMLDTPDKLKGASADGLITCRDRRDNRAAGYRTALSLTLAAPASRPDDCIRVCRFSRRRWWRRGQILQIEDHACRGAARASGVDRANERRP